MRNGVREARKAANLTQIELAMKSGVSLPTIRRIEAGRTVSVPVLMKLSATLGTTVDDLIGGDDDATADH